MRNCKNPDAVACVRGVRGCPAGTVGFYQNPHCVTVEAELSGLPENGSGFYGLHIHEGCSCAGEKLACGEICLYF